ncbi:MAG: protein-L-isoaspartate(D-aspartate) O-methyltransferase [Gammaproteobacteria bacterium]|nr:protein-L-isoaspartate(D-aspartate) O-methyltransferase [Gammaproteobacteria bacterium]
MNIRHEGIGMTSQRTRDRLVDRLRKEGIRDERVLEVIRNTPRHLFMDEAMSSRAYEDTALPIGHGQTISQPYIVARMTEALITETLPQKVLEIGTGSGYQTAVLAQLVPELYTVERIVALLEKAKQQLQSVQANKVRFLHGDGYQGWAEHGPYDGIMVTAAPPEVPAALLEQLAEGGRMVIPTGPAGEQRLLVITRNEGEFNQQILDWVSFVPLKEGLS